MAQVNVDNQIGIQLLKGQRIHDRSKHFRFQHSFFREEAINVDVTAKYLPTKQNVADTIYI